MDCSCWEQELNVSFCTWTFGTCVHRTVILSPNLLSVTVVLGPDVPMSVFLRRVPRVCETSMSLLSSLCSNGLNVLLTGRHYLWQRFPQCQLVHRGKHSSKGTFFSGCQTQLHQQWRALRVWLQPFLGRCCMEQCLLSSITSPETLAPSLLPSLNSFPKRKVKTLFISDQNVLSNNSNEVFWNQKAEFALPGHRTMLNGLPHGKTLWEGPKSGTTLGVYCHFLELRNPDFLGSNTVLSLLRGKRQVLYSYSQLLAKPFTCIITDQLTWYVWWIVILLVCPTREVYLICEEFFIQETQKGAGW